MPSTHTNLHVHITFSTKNRQPHITASWRSNLHAYAGGTIRGLGATALAVGGIADHIHLLIGMKATQCVADLVRELKKATSVWAQQNDPKFGWQDGYGAFSVGRRELDVVANYIRHQEEHHRGRTFQDEYLALLDAEGVAFDPRYLW
jgi:REP element-mobilizing transposase RayT